MTSPARKYFGTDGIRGKVGDYPITPEFVLKLGWAMGRVLVNGNNKILIGKDTRISGYMFESALEAGLSAAGADIYLLGPMPTPAIAYLTAAKLVGEKGKVYALDILPMPPLPEVDFIQGDFRDEAVLQQLLNHLQSIPVDLVISDMAPNLSGMRTVDQPRAMYLAELALDFAQRVLKPKGGFIIKTFQGEGFEAYLGLLRQLFKTVSIRKPAASRGTSAEVYLVATGYHLQNNGLNS